MNKRQLLFVTYRDEHVDEGISYAIELAKAMLEDIVVLLVRKKETLKEQLETLMTGAAFAEAGEQEIAREIVTGAGRDLPAIVKSKTTEMVLQSSKAGVHLEVLDTDKDVVSGIRSYLRDAGNIDKVVLSPAVTESEMLTTRDLNRLVRTASRPIVTMTRQSVQAAREERVRKGGPLRYVQTAGY
jgi:predicted AAA+ superfamily ATPase